MKRWLGILTVLLGVQGALTLAYLALERRDDEARVDARPENRAAPELVYVRPDGTRGRLAEHRGAPVLLHFWATWCPPCRDELPALLELAGEVDHEVLAVSLDPTWAEVRAFTGGPPPAPVVRALTATAADAFGVRGLPETLVVDRRGRIRRRFVGARDWAAPAVRAALEPEG